MYFKGDYKLKNLNYINQIFLFKNNYYTEHKINNKLKAKDNYQTCIFYV